MACGPVWFHIALCKQPGTRVRGGLWKDSNKGGECLQLCCLYLLAPSLSLRELLHRPGTLQLVLEYLTSLQAPTEKTHFHHSLSSPLTSPTPRNVPTGTNDIIMGLVSRSDNHLWFILFPHPWVLISLQRLLPSVPLLNTAFLYRWNGLLSDCLKKDKTALSRAVITSHFHAPRRPEACTALGPWGAPGAQWHARHRGPCLPRE